MADDGCILTLPVITAFALAAVVKFAMSLVEYRSIRSFL